MTLFGVWDKFAANQFRTEMVLLAIQSSQPISASGLIMAYIIALAVVLACLLPTLVLADQGAARHRSNSPHAHGIRDGLPYVLASYYGAGESVSRYTASGEPFDPLGMTAAHRILPVGTRVLVVLGDRRVVVRVNDRGPDVASGRSLDLSYGAARELASYKLG